MDVVKRLQNHNIKPSVPVSYTHLMERLNTIKELINQGNVEQAIQQLDEILQTDFPGKDEAY